MSAEVNLFGFNAVEQQTPTCKLLDDFAMDALSLSLDTLVGKV